jgi:alanine-glyoxylate transaminase/serine-glyoxylate transaminase/serine-pyruvate transaminase
MDPAFFTVMDETMEGLRRVFRTSNRMTLPISASGSAGLEAAAVNILEPGDRLVVGVTGFFGARLAEMARRCGAEVSIVEAPAGRPVDPGQIAAALATRPVKAVAVVHGETSTGILQPLDEISRAVRTKDALFFVDCVSTLGGTPLEVDALGIDVAYSGSQKCLSAPPGLAPLTLSDRAVAAVRARKRPVQSWYLDLVLLERYWGEGERAYHHTAPVSMVYALREAVRLVLEEGLEARWARHRQAQQALAAGMERLGLEFSVAAEHRMAPLSVIRIPDGVDDGSVRRRLLDEHGIEIAGGLGPQAGKIWRVGLMGHGARLANVERLIDALGACLRR